MTNTTTRAKGIGGKMTRPGRFACPECGDSDNLHTVEMVPVEYAIQKAADTTCGYQYTGESKVFDEGGDAESIHCRNCDYEERFGDLGEPLQSWLSGRSVS